jgi:hypothetical protein
MDIIIKILEPSCATYPIAVRVDELDVAAKTVPSNGGKLLERDKRPIAAADNGPATNQTSLCVRVSRMSVRASSKRDWTVLANVFAILSHGVLASPSQSFQSGCTLVSLASEDFMFDNQDMRASLVFQLDIDGKKKRFE